MVSVPVLHKAMGISLQQAEGQLSLQPVAEQLPPLQAMDEGQLSHQPIAQQQLSLQPLAEGQSSLQALMVDDNRNIVPTRNEQLTVSHSQQSMWEPVWDFLTIYGSRNETLQLQTKLANQASPPPTTGVNNPPKEFAPMYWLVLSTIIIFLTQKNLQTANWLHTEIPKPIVLCLQWSRNIHFTQEKKKLNTAACVMKLDAVCRIGKIEYLSSCAVSSSTRKLQLLQDLFVFQFRLFICKNLLSKILERG